MRINQYFWACLAILPIALAQSSNSTSAPTASATPNNSSLQVITTTLTSLITIAFSVRITSSICLSHHISLDAHGQLYNFLRWIDHECDRRRWEWEWVFGKCHRDRALERRRRLYSIWNQDRSCFWGFGGIVDPEWDTCGYARWEDEMVSCINMARADLFRSSVAIASAYSFMLFTLVLILRFG
jgi:hypothetical protein